jgi:hypothetical protein
MSEMGMGGFGMGAMPNRRGPSRNQSPTRGSQFTGRAGRAMTPAQQQQRNQAEQMTGNRPAVPINPGQGQRSNRPMSRGQLAGLSEFGRQGRRRAAYDSTGQKRTLAGNVAPKEPKRNPAPLVQLPKPSTSFRDDMLGFSVNTSELADNE